MPTPGSRYLRLADGRLVKLAYLDAAQRTSLTESDFIFAAPGSGPAVFDGLFEVAVAQSAMLQLPLTSGEQAGLDLKPDHVEVGKVKVDFSPLIATMPIADVINSQVHERIAQFRGARVSLGQLRDDLSEVSAPTRPHAPVSAMFSDESAQVAGAVNSLVDAMAAFTPAAGAAMTFAPSGVFPGDMPVVATVA